LSQIIRPFTAARADKACGLAGHTEEAIAAFKAYNASSPGFGLLDLVILYQENGLPDEEKQRPKVF
jgi:hypothetical protein